MTYFKLYKDKDAKAVEITKEEARKTLDNYWNKESLDDIFDNEKSFRLYTPFAYVWTKTADGAVPMAGFIGVCE